MTASRPDRGGLDESLGDESSVTERYARDSIRRQARTTTSLLTHENSNAARSSSEPSCFCRRRAALLSVSPINILPDLCKSMRVTRCAKSDSTESESPLTSECVIDGRRSSASDDGSRSFCSKSCDTALLATTGDFFTADRSLIESKRAGSFAGDGLRSSNGSKSATDIRASSAVESSNCGNDPCFTPSTSTFRGASTSDDSLVCDTDVDSTVAVCASIYLSPIVIPSFAVDAAAATTLDVPLSSTQPAADTSSTLLRLLTHAIASTAKITKNHSRNSTIHFPITSRNLSHIGLLVDQHHQIASVRTWC
jgi:hypothetical protein